MKVIEISDVAIFTFGTFKIISLVFCPFAVDAEFKDHERKAYLQSLA